MNIPPGPPVVLSRQQTRRVDELAAAQLGMSSLVLMENAGRGVADVLSSLGIAGPVVIACGKGNNGGDGFVVARHLINRGHAVRTLLWADPTQLTGDAAANYGILWRSGIPVKEMLDPAHAALLASDLDGADWLVDALLGTGAHGEPRAPYDKAIDAINAAPGRKLAIDLPSGLDCDTGVAARHTIRADHTCTFVAYKPGLLVPGAERFVGEVHVVDIGVPRALIDQVGAQR